MGVVFKSAVEVVDVAVVVGQSEVAVIEVARVEVSGNVTISVVVVVIVLEGDAGVDVD